MFRHLPHMSPPQPVEKRLARAAFSLVELLTVIGIIAVLSTLGILGFRSTNRGADVRGAANLASSMALSARVEAMAMGLGSVLVVDNNSLPSGTGDRLQRMAVFRKVPDPANSASFTYQLVGRVMRLQTGIYFLPGYSDGFQETTINFPEAPNTPVFAYEFTPTGHIDDSQMVNDIRMVFSAGPLDASNNPVSETIAAGRGGILLRKNGRPTFFTSPQQMNPVN